MAYTNDDLTAVQTAIMDLARGERVTRIEHNGRKVEYAATDLHKLETLKRIIQQDLARQKRRQRSRTRVVMTSKGV